MCPDESEIQINIQAALERLTAPEFLFKNGLFPDAVNRRYYSMFHAVIALLLQRGIAVKTHTGLIAKFGEEYIQTGIIDREFGRMLARAEELREKADYSLLSPITQEQAYMVVHDAHSFLDEIRSHLNWCG
ncbi:MAG: HEPN domain-containing protein [Methanospirillum sp.]|uniref:HEPN domain-containing protein n=1 Tax=Methanospirillum sp. TaxID=45200 RepID=UPI00236C662A|nr:HEPN domain-containing protein [Methanospirillum sp.]MDD1728910.1 HEPN domain-containing protein [Methanospirillum sp.]